MDNNFTYLNYSETGFFSHLVTDYLDDHPHIQPFYGYPPGKEGLWQAIDERCKFPVNRIALTEALSRQYQPLTLYTKVTENILLLQQENTFTVCTAHQPNLLTGYLYFIYKIVHAIKLAEQLRSLHPEKNFVPVYYMGSEDNDLEELGAFRFRGEKYAWDGDGQSGAVGRMKTAGLKKVLNQLFKVFGPPGKNCDDLREMLIAAYSGRATIGAATQYLVNELFGKHGLIVLDPDDATLKRAFIPVMEDELLNSNAYSIISEQVEKLGRHYKIQAQPRPINLFYLADQLRERIEQHEEKWVVVNTKISWTRDELLNELRTNPERFSPNVMLRGLFQETILPDVAFIGGGAEVAYWLQLKTLFQRYGVFYPHIHLRQSVLWIKSHEAQLRRQLDLEIPQIFKPELQLIRDYISGHSANEWQTKTETDAMNAIFQVLKQKANEVDPTLLASADATLTRMKHQLEELEKKMLRAEKRKMKVQVDRINRLKTRLFPGGSLQERIENFMEYYLEYGDNYIDVLKDGMNPLEPRFLVIES